MQSYRCFVFFDNGMNIINAGCNYRHSKNFVTDIADDKGDYTTICHGEYSQKAKK